MTAEPPRVPSGLTLRPATADDLDALAALEVESFGEAAWSREQLAAGLAAAGVLWLAGVTAGPQTPLRAYAAFQRAADEAELLRVAVPPSARRRGIGTAVVAAGLDRLRAAGARACFLEVAEDNRPALALYRRLGFRPVGRRPGYYRRGGDALLLRVDLAPAGAPD